MKKIYTYLILGCLCCSCAYNAEFVQEDDSPASGPVKVGLALGDGAGDFQIVTKSEATSDGLSSIWEEGDRIAVWAVAPDGSQALAGTPFTAYAITPGKSFFTATLPASMPDRRYTYYASYPVPESVSGTTATFSVPALQDGRSGSGEDIMVSDPASYGALGPVDWLDYDHGELSLSMNHLLHRFRFYTEASQALGGEDILKIVADFPRDIAGTVSVDLASPSAGAPSSGATSRIVIEPGEPVPVSQAGQARNYLTASFIPTAFSVEESLNVTLYTETKIARTTIPLQGRTYAAGHSTAVKIIPQKVGTLCRVYVNLDANNLGEDIQTITLTAPAGCKWGDSLSNEYVYSPGGSFSAGESFILEFENEDAFRTLSGKTITATYDSEHVTISEEIGIESLAGKYSTTLRLRVPYLLEEDFSSVGTFSSNDEYSSTFNTGSKDAYAFLDGWTGARIGAEAGKCIRIACRRETSANYHARVDSSPLRGTLKSPVNLSVEFDYGADNQYGGISLLSDPNVGQTCYIGYVTSATGYKSGDTTGTFESDNSFYVKEYTGSYDSTPNTAAYTIHSAPAGNLLRLTIRTEIESRAGANNTTDWLYIDNIKIKIAK